MGSDKQRRTVRSEADKRTALMKLQLALGDRAIEAGLVLRRRHALRQHYTGKLRLSDVRFEQMRDHSVTGLCIL